MKKIILPLMLFLAFLFLNSCNSDNEIKLEENEKTTYNIKSIQDVSDDEYILVLDFLSTKNEYHSIKDFNSIETVLYDNLPGKAIVLKENLVNQKSNEEKSIIIVIGKENEILTNFEYIKVDDGQYYIINTSIEGENWFMAKVDKNTEEIIEFNMASDTQSKMKFMECAKMAVSACVNDGACAFMCGILWQYCLGSIGLACAYVAIT